MHTYAEHMALMKDPRLRRFIWWGIPAITGAILVLAYIGISFQLATSITEAERKPLESSPAVYGLDYEDVQFTPRGEDFVLEGWYISGEGQSRTVIFVHGLNSNREENEDYLKISSAIVNRGYNTLLFDLRGHGTSEGKRVSGGFYERQDVLGAFDYLVQRGSSPNQIGVFGFSMGAATAALSVAEEPEIRALVIDSSFADVAEMIAQETAKQTPFPESIVPVFIPGMDFMADLFYGIDIGAIVPEDAVQRLDYPILIIHGGGDTRIKPENSERIYSVAPEGSELWIAPDVEHTDAFPTYPDQYIEKLITYLDSRLRTE